ncbi:hypothetical protein Bpfe_007920 [Biomphalaria pfeifferi]|uniref:Uncharacterized protein n=1 Tax=Biomphalaria pfeifferi TaxID=112525 RepID=A0AAD8BZI6_BIOPF|nr:hypothetical protein Bpfe_007920 [Biomphalaria pfeifferi]
MKYIASVLVVVCITSGVSATRATDSLLEKLKDTTFPWFGENQTECTGNNTNLKVNCFNVRREHLESILERAGVSSEITLTKVLNVTFKAEKEGVDVCGKTTLLEEVPPFQLDPEGRPLKQTTEAYRNQPEVEWDADADKIYSLVLFDVGMLKVRGWWYNVVKESNGDIQGKIYGMYQPPANPTANKNPILIILFEQKTTLKTMDEEMYQICIKVNPTREAADNCRTKLKEWTNDLTIVGLQVYYTEGYTLYQQYRACIESYPCSEECIDKFKQYVNTTEDKQGNVRFQNFDKVNLDHYVNVNFYTTRQYTESELYDSTEHNSMSEEWYVDWRARPGDNMQVKYSDTRVNAFKGIIKVHFEIGAPLQMYTKEFVQNPESYYTLLIIDQDVPEIIKNPLCNYYKTNIQFPNIEGSVNESLSFIDFAPLNSSHQYHILLFSRNNTSNENLLFKYNEVWHINSTKLDAYTLRAVSWLTVSSDDQITCPELGRGGCLWPQPLTSAYLKKSIVVQAWTNVTFTSSTSSPPTSWLLTSESVPTASETVIPKTTVFIAPKTPGRGCPANRADHEL